MKSLSATARDYITLIPLKAPPHFIERTGYIESEWYLYLIRCRDGSIYTGITTDVERRFEEHTSAGKKSARYLRGRGPLELVFQEYIGNRATALKLEYLVKQLPKIKKLYIVKGRLELQSLLKRDGE